MPHRSLKKHFLVAAPILFGAFALFIGALPAHAANYLYSRSITVTSSASVASGTNLNFPMLVSSTLASWKSVGNGGNIQNLITSPTGVQEPADLVFATSSANCNTTGLNFETERYVSSTGELEDWVNVPSVSTGTVIYACYDDASVVTDQSHPSSTWNSKYRAVYHLGENAATTTIHDSTANAFTGVAGTSTKNTATSTGKIDGAKDLTEQATDYINLDTINHFNASGGSYVLSVWINPHTGQGNDGYIFDVASGNTGNRIVLDSGQNAGNTASIGLSTNLDPNISLSSNNSIVANAWQKIDVELNSGTGIMSGYLNGVLTGTSTYSTLSTLDGVSGGSAIGSRFSTDIHIYGGILDEFRFSQATTSPSWILTEYNNETNPNAFYTIGSEQSSGAAILTMSSATVNATGTTITIPISGVNGTLSCPGNACTGFTITNLNSNNPAATINSATVSG